MATLRGDHKRVQEIIRSKHFDPNEQDVAGRTALFAASHSCDSNCVRLLLARGADPDLVDKSGQTALFHAVCGSTAGIVALLLQAGAKPNVVDERGQTPLFFAARFGKDEALRLLVQAGANTNIVDAEGHHALDYARQEAPPQTVKLLAHARMTPDTPPPMRKSRARQMAAAAEELKTEDPENWQVVPADEAAPVVPRTHDDATPLLVPLADATDSMDVEGSQETLENNAAGAESAESSAPLLAWLAEHGLEVYGEALLDAGYDDLSLFELLRPEEFEEMLNAAGVRKPGHRAKFRHAASQTAARA